MIVYDLVCSAGHRFEGWFDSPCDFDRQHTAQQIACPECGNSHVRKLPSAARLVGSTPGPIAEHRPAQETPLQRLHEVVQRHYEDVGDSFPEEARRIHYGEAEERRIRGTATATEARELVEEGIAVLPLPPATDDKRGLN